jgi:hypothetical protein
MGVDSSSLRVCLYALGLLFGDDYAVSSFHLKVRGPSVIDEELSISNGGG